jgi:hypothetical protein
MSFGLSARRSVLLHIRGLIDAEGGGSLSFFDTSMPSDSSADPGGAALAVVALEEVSCVLDDTEAVLTIVEVVGNASAAGFPSWCRFSNGGGAGVGDFPVGPPGSGAPIIVTNGEDPPSHQFYTGGEITVMGTIPFPA